MSYQYTTDKGELVYSGTGNAIIADDQESVRELIVQEFEYDDVKANALINIILVKPETLPQLEIEELTSTARGYKNDTGKLDLVLSFKGEILDTRDLNFKTGPAGNEELIEFTEILEDGLNFKLIKDSGQSGKEIVDTVTLMAKWKDPDRIIHNLRINIRVTVDMLSVVKVDLVIDQPFDIAKYGFANFPIRVTIDGKDATKDMKGLKLVDPDDYIVVYDEKTKQLQCLGTPATTSNHPVKFTWTQTFDRKDNAMEQEVVFNIEAWTGDTVAIVPSSFHISGRSDEGGSFSFKVYNDRIDITKEAVYSEALSEWPEHVVMRGNTYNDTTKLRTVSYFKEQPTQAAGQICYTVPGDENPIDTNIGKLKVTADVEQSRILKVVEQQNDGNVVVDGTADIKLKVSFAGKEIKLDDPNLKVEEINTDRTDIRMVRYSAFAVLITDTVYSYQGVKKPSNFQLKLTYKDTEDNADKELIVSIPVTVEYPPVILYYDKKPIETRIWAKDSLPIILKGGVRDFTAKIVRSEQLTKSKYISTSRLNYEVVNAEKTRTTDVIPFRLVYALDGVDNTDHADTELTFNIAAWDGITFQLNYDPKALAGESGVGTTIAMTAVYKGKDATKGIEFNTGTSTIPLTVLVGNHGVDETGDKPVFKLAFTTRRGGKEPFIIGLKITDPTTGEVVYEKAQIEMDIAWPDGLNPGDIGGEGGEGGEGPGEGEGEGTPNDDKNPGDIKGYSLDTIDYRLVYNFAGEPVDLTADNVTVSLDVAEAGVIEVLEVLPNSLRIKLLAGGDLGQTNEWESTLTMVYTDTTGKDHVSTSNPKVSIKVPNVLVGSNPVNDVKVFDHGPLKVTLVDERGKMVEITKFVATAENQYVKLLPNDEWYVQSGSVTQQINTKLALDLYFSMGGKDNLVIAAEVPFVIARYDAISFKVETPVSKIEGESGDSAEVPFEFTLKGFPAKNVTLDRTRSIIPDNLRITDLVDDKLTYQLIGEGNENAKLVFLREDAPSAPVLNQDMVEVLWTVISTVPVEPEYNFELVSSDANVEVVWGKTETYGIKTKFNGKELPANSPGLTYSLDDETLVKASGSNADGVILKGIGSDGPKTSKKGTVKIIAMYDVGLTGTLNVDATFEATVTTGEPELVDNDTVVAKIWDKGVFKQRVVIDDVNAAVKSVSLKEGTTTEFIEIVPPRSYEVISSSKVTEDHNVELTATYVVDGKEFTMDFTGVFNIEARDMEVLPRFYVKANPAAISGLEGREVTVSYDPIYKDQSVGSRATFKLDQSTLPEHLEYVSSKVEGGLHLITYRLAKKGTAEATIVFWSPEAGMSPKPRDIAEVVTPVRVVGEFGLEVGDRDNLLETKHNQEGSYKLVLLNAGIELDIAEEIKAGRLKGVSVGHNATLKNPTVLAISSWNADGFNYKTSGLVVPGATTNVSDYIDFTYTVGAETSNIRVEIPMAYTNSPAVVQMAGANGTPISTSIWKTGTYTPVMSCEGIPLTEFSIAREKTGENNGYITVGRTTAQKGWEVVNADKEIKTLTINVEFIGKNMVWDWIVPVEVAYKLEAWDGNTFQPKFTGFGRGYVDSKYANTYFYLYKGVRAKFNTSTQDPEDFIDYDRSDLKGMIKVPMTVKSMDQNVVNYESQNNYLVKEEKVSICWMRPGGAIPGVEGIDFAIMEYDIDVINKVLVVAQGTAVTGGNGDIANTPTNVTLKPNGNVEPNNPNLTVESLDETMLKVVGVTSTSVQYEVMAPLEMMSGQTVVDIKFTWNDPGTKLASTAIHKVTLNHRAPLDYPTINIRNPQPFPPYKPLVLWQYGAIDTWFRVEVKEGTATKDITKDCTLKSLTPGWIFMSEGFPKEDTVWQCLDMPRVASPTGDYPGATTFTVTAPFRETTVDLELYVKSDGRNVGDLPTKPFIATIQGNDVVEGGLGKVTELKVKTTWRDQIYSPVFKKDLSTVGGDKLEDKFTIGGISIDGATGITTIPLTSKGDVNGAIILRFELRPDDLARDQAPNEPGLNVTYTNVRATAATIEWTAQDPDPVECVWLQSIRLSDVTRLMSGTTDITPKLTLIDLDRKEFQTVYATGTTGPGFAFNGDDEVGPYEGPLVLTLRGDASLKNEVFTKTINVKHNGFDGVIFKVTNTGNKVPSGKVGANINVQTKSSLRGWNSTKNTLFDQLMFINLNKGKPVKWVTGGGESDPNWNNFTFSEPFKGTLKLPYKLTGIPSDYPEGTQGKNMDVIEVEFDIYDSLLHFWPDDKEPDAITGIYNKPVRILCKFAFEEMRPVDPQGITMKPLVGHNPYVDQGINFENGLDVTLKYQNNSTETMNVEFPVAWVYNYGGRVSPTLEYMQKLIIEPSGKLDEIRTGEVASPTVNVWSLGALPFNVYLNEQPVGNSRYKSITVKDNPYIRTNPAWVSGKADAYQVYNGEKTSTKTTVTFVVVVTDTVKDFTIEQDVEFTINPYDGVQLKIDSFDKTPFNQGLTFTIGSGAMFRLNNPTFQGKSIANPHQQYGIWDAKSTFHGLKDNTKYNETSGVLNGEQYTYIGMYYASTTDMLVSEVGKIVFGRKDKMNDPTAVEGVDYITIDIPMYCYNQNKFYPRNDVVSSTSFTGSFDGQPYGVNLFVRKGLETVHVSTGTWYLDVDNELTKLAPGRPQGDMIYNLFKAELTTAKTKTIGTVFSIGQTDNTLLQAKFPMKITQISNLDFPEFVDPEETTEVSIGFGDTKPPFGVIYKGTDVSSTAKVVGVTANDYIEMVGNEWVVYNARSGDTTINVEFLVNVTTVDGIRQTAHTVPLVVKAWDGELTFTNVKDITAKTWDKSSVLPFTVQAGGRAVKSTRITSIALEPGNGYVSVGPQPTNAWKIVKGDTGTAIDVVSSYKVTVGLPNRTVTGKQDVNFHIEKWDGVSFKLELVEGGDVRNGVFIARNDSNSVVSVGVRGIYQGEPGTGLSNGEYLGQGGFNIRTAPAGPATTLYFQYTSARFMHNRQTSVRVGASRSGTSTKAQLDIPAFLYGDEQYHIALSDAGASGKFGDTMTVLCKLFGDAMPPNPIHLSVPSMTIIAGADFVEIVPNSKKLDTLDLRFLKDTSETVTKTVSINMAKTPGSTNRDILTLSVTQYPSKDPIVATAEDQSVVYDQVGEIRVVGSVGEKPLSEAVEFDSEQNGPNGLVTLGEAKVDGNDILVPFTAVKLGKKDITLRFKLKGSTIDASSISGLDYKDVKLNMNVDYAPLAPAADFVSEGSGNSKNPLTLKQSVTKPE